MRLLSQYKLYGDLIKYYLVERHNLYFILFINVIINWIDKKELNWSLLYLFVLKTIQYTKLDLIYHGSRDVWYQVQLWESLVLIKTRDLMNFPRNEGKYFWPQMGDYAQSCDTCQRR